MKWAIENEAFLCRMLENSKVWTKTCEIFSSIQSRLGDNKWINIRSKTNSEELKNEKNQMFTMIWSYSLSIIMTPNAGGQHAMGKNHNQKKKEKKRDSNNSKTVWMSKWIIKLLEHCISTVEFGMQCGFFSLFAFFDVVGVFNQKTFSWFTFWKVLRYNSTKQHRKKMCIISFHDQILRFDSFCQMLNVKTQYDDI